MQNSDWQQEFDARGFVVLRGVFDPGLTAKAGTAAERLHEDWTAHRALRTAGLRCLERDGPEGRLLDGVQGIFRHSEPFAALRAHRAVQRLLFPRLGTDIVTVVDTLFLKPPAQAGSGIAFHRDAQFRKPADAFRDLGQTYVQVGIALDEHGPENGGMVFLPASHLTNEIDAVQRQSVRGIDDLNATLKDEASARVSINLHPGDIVLWSAHVIHGSPPNHSSRKARKFYVLGYMAAHACDAGDQVTFAAGP